MPALFVFASIQYLCYFMRRKATKGRRKKMSVTLVHTASIGENASAEELYGAYVGSKSRVLLLVWWFRAEVREHPANNLLWQDYLKTVTADYLIGHEANRMEI